jgi:GTP-binding protein
LVIESYDIITIKIYISFKIYKIIRILVDMLDKVSICGIAGNGGNGAVSFHHEKFVPLGGPDGGDGGKGGSIIIKADADINNLNYYLRRRLFKAEKGANGGSNKKTGKCGEDLILKVPVGTVVTYQKAGEEEESVVDVTKNGQEVIVANGGKGGLGNPHFSSSTNQTPRLAQTGEEGEEVYIDLEMHLIADVGIIGYPNAGKSSLLASSSAANPKIANYPFTTLEPMLGVVDCKNQVFVMAEIPGLIKDAHVGKGLGFDFLRHIVRTRVLIHLIDGNTEDPLESMIAVNNELYMYDADLMKKSQIIAINKIDIPEVKEREGEIRNSFLQAGYKNVCFISALTGEGVNELMEKAFDLIRESKLSEEKPAEEIPVLKVVNRNTEPVIEKDGDVFVVTYPFLERMIYGSDITNPEVKRQIISVMTRPRITKQLTKAGVEPGCRVRVGDFEWEW